MFLKYIYNIIQYSTYTYVCIPNILLAIILTIIKIIFIIFMPQLSFIHLLDLFINKQTYIKIALIVQIYAVNKNILHINLTAFFPCVAFGFLSQLFADLIRLKELITITM